MEALNCSHRDSAPRMAASSSISSWNLLCSRSRSLTTTADRTARMTSGVGVVMADWTWSSGTPAWVQRKLRSTSAAAMVRDLGGST